MLALFCLRLAAGMIVCLLLLPPSTVNPRFYRTHCLTALGLASGALFLAPQTGSWVLPTLLGVGMFLAFAAAFSWFLEGAPGGISLVVLLGLTLVGGLGVLEASAAGKQGLLATLVGGGTSALLLGAAVTAMLLGHSYLIAPSMSIKPLLGVLFALGVCLGMRMAVDGFALGRWTNGHSLGNLSNDLLLWLPVRWLVGFVLPLGLLWMAWQTARIRSTQSATGILYVLVIFCFLGELTSQLLRGSGLTL